MSMNYQNIAAGTMLTGWQNAMTSAATQAATEAYQKASLAGLSDDRALNAAKFAWQQKMDEATQTGMWNGQWNNPQEQWFTGQFGQWYGPGGAPGVGDQTLQAQQQGYGQSNALGGMYGQYYAPGTAPVQGAQGMGQITSAQQTAESQAGLTGWYKGAGDFRVAPTEFAYADPAAQQQYLQYAQGDKDVAAQRWAADASNARRQAWDANPGSETMQHNQQMFNQNMSAQTLALQAQNQYQTQAQNYLQLMSQLRGPADYAKYQQVLGSTPQGMRDLVGAAMGQYVPGGGATTGVNPQAATLQTMQQQIAGGAQPGSGTAAEASGGGTNVFGNLPAPNQIAAQSWKNLAPSQQQMLLGAYESQGWNKDDVSSLMNQSMPKYATNAPGAGTWRLQ